MVAARRAGTVVRPAMVGTPVVETVASSSAAALQMVEVLMQEMADLGAEEMPQVEMEASSLAEALQMVAARRVGTVVPVATAVAQREAMAVMSLVLLYE